VCPPQSPDSIEAGSNRSIIDHFSSLEFGQQRLLFAQFKTPTLYTWPHQRIVTQSAQMICQPIDPHGKLMLLNYFESLFGVHFSTLLLMS
jgi:hypothetical protein